MSERERIEKGEAGRIYLLPRESAEMFKPKS
jgi:hypothetical protein